MSGKLSRSCRAPEWAVSKSLKASRKVSTRETDAPASETFLMALGSSRHSTIRDATRGAIQMKERKCDETMPCLRLFDQQRQGREISRQYHQDGQAQEKDESVSLHLPALGPFGRGTTLLGGPGQAVHEAVDHMAVEPRDDAGEGEVDLVHHPAVTFIDEILVVGQGMQGPEGFGQR